MSNFENPYSIAPIKKIQNKMAEKCENIAFEDDESITFSQWLTLKGIRHHHGNDNMHSRSWKQRTTMKRKGFSRGFPDFVVVLPRCLVFIEMKRRKKSYANKDQKEWIRVLNGCSCVRAQVCFGADEAISLIESLL